MWHLGLQQGGVAHSRTQPPGLFGNANASPGGNSGRLAIWGVILKILTGQAEHLC